MSNCHCSLCRFFPDFIYREQISIAPYGREFVWSEYESITDEPFDCTIEGHDE